MLSVTAAGIIVAVCSSFFDEKSVTGVLCRMISGVFITLAILSPMGDIRLERIDSRLEKFESVGQQAADRGLASASDTREEIIRQRVTAYILDKARALQTELDVSVTLSEGDLALPESVKLTGKISPYARTRLQHIITEDLGIPKERQIWIG